MHELLFYTKLFTRGDLLKIGIAGGTFNPIHLGHLIIAEYMKCKFFLDKVIFIPSNNPPHKDRNAILDATHRYEMVRLATESNPDFEVSDIELQREGVTYTVDTLEELHSIYGNTVDFFFLSGADVVFDIRNWRSPEKVLKLCTLITTGRPTHNIADFESGVKELVNKYNARVLTADSPLIDISSTMIRDRIQKGLSIKYLVPELVEQYIINNKLYIRE